MLLDGKCQPVVLGHVFLRDIDRPDRSAHIGDNRRDRQSISAFEQRNLNMHAVLDPLGYRPLLPVETGLFFPAALFIDT